MLFLSEQQLVDRDVVDSGCNGELMHTTPSLSPRKVPRARRSVTATSQPMPITNERDQLSFQSCSSGVLTCRLDGMVSNPKTSSPCRVEDTRRSVSWRLHTMRCRAREGRNHFPHVREEGHDVAAETTSATVMLAREAREKGSASYLVGFGMVSARLSFQFMHRNSHRTAGHTVNASSTTTTHNTIPQTPHHDHTTCTHNTTDRETDKERQGKRREDKMEREDRREE